MPSTVPFQFPAINDCWNCALEVKRLYVAKSSHSLVFNFFSVLGRDRTGLSTSCITNARPPKKRSSISVMHVHGVFLRR